MNYLPPGLQTDETWRATPADNPAPRTTPALNDRHAFLFGLFWIYLVGAGLRMPLFANHWFGLLVSAAMDSTVIVILLANLTIQRWAWSALRPASFIAVLCIDVTVSVGLMLAAGRLMVRVTGLGTSPYTLLSQVLYYGMVFAAWSAVAAWLRARADETAKLLAASATEQAALQREMRLLRSQIDSHFIFNALNTVAVEIHDNPRRALRMVQDLSHYLRYSLDSVDRKLVTVSTEIAALRSFLRVQQARFGSKLTFRVEQSATSRGRLIPAFLVQPMVENAAKHGIPDDDVLHIHISVTVEGDALLISVSNPGDLAAEAGADPARAGTGTGLLNLTRRLEVHYPGRHSFNLFQDGNLVRADLRLEGAAC